MFMLMLAVCLTASMLAAPDARATDDPFEQTDGVYVGHSFDKAAERVTIELRGSSLVILDKTSLGIMTVARWELAGPSKAGDIQLKTLATPRAAASRAGPAQAKVAPKGESAVRLRLWPDRRAVLCMTDPRKKALEIRHVPPLGATTPLDPGITCYDLKHVWSPRDNPPQVAPKLPEPDFECMRECRQQNMMRAVGPDVIEADCRAACSRP